VTGEASSVGDSSLQALTLDRMFARFPLHFTMHCGPLVHQGAHLSQGRAYTSSCAMSTIVSTIVKYGDTGVQRRSMECTRHQITRTLASTYVLHPRELLVQYFGGPEYKSGGQGGRRTGGVPDVQVGEEFKRT
jgi:hypothetical protein